MDVLRRRLLLASFALALPACKKKPPATTGSGVGATKTRPIGPFSSIKVAGVEFIVSVGKQAPLEVSGDDNLLSYVSTQIEGTTLVIRREAKLKQLQPLRVRVGSERLERVLAGAGARGSIEGVSGEAFELEATGGAKVTVRGSSGALKVSVRGPTRLDLSGFSARRGVVTATDVSSIELGYLEELDATLSGLSRVSYLGEPKLTQNVTQPARLSRRR
ncbi:MAG TPA: DUF2807 domain-containing protein [Polyangiaceae bacterium]